MSLYNPVPVRILDTAGRPIAGAHAYFYRSGTSTLTAVYADAALSTPRTNPVIADIHGLLPAIYLDDSILYRVVFTGADGDTASPIYAVNSVGGAARATSPIDTTSGAAYTVTGDDVGRIKRRQHSANMTATLPAAASAGNGFWTTLWNDTAARTLTVSVSGGGTINGSASMVLQPGQRATFTSDGSAWIAVLPALLTGYREISFPAGAFVPRTTNGPAYEKVEATTFYDVNFDAYRFDASTEEGLNLTFRLPSSYSGGAIGVRIQWTPFDGAASVGDVVTWGIAGRGLADGEAIDQAFGTEATQADAVTALYCHHETALFNFTPVNASGGDTLQVLLVRKTGGMTEDAYFRGAAFLIPLNKSADE